MTISKSRSSSLDIIRIIAFCSVVAVHFFLNTNFYHTTIQYPIHFLMIIVRTSALVCVPLFLLLTGYLMNKKALSKAYYIGIIKTISIYIFASLACYINKVVVSNNNFDILKFLMDLLSFKAAKYSWYIEMYIGLFLLIPFLNLIYNNLTSKKQKQILLVTFIALTSLSPILNVYDLTSLIPFLSGVESTGYNEIFPDWWTLVYPITYYFIGAYLKEYKPKIKLIKSASIYAIVLILFSVYCYYRSYGHNFLAGKFQEWGALPVMILTVILFHTITLLKTEKFPNPLKNILAKVSDLTLCAYLVSEIFDKLIYNYLSENITPILEEQFKYYLPCVFLIIILSLALSYLINLIYSMLYETAMKLINFKNKKLSRK